MFTKVPKTGVVKTRIKHPQLAAEFAKNLQIAMVKDTILCLKEISQECVPILSFYPEKDHLALDQLILTPLKLSHPDILNPFHIIPQNGSTIEQRFESVFSFAFNDLGLASAFIIGSDTPHLQPSLLKQCISMLQRSSKAAVLGPSQNGGFYLLGHTRPFIPTIGSIFQTYNELGSAMRLLAHNDKTIHILPEVTDVDTFSDLKTVRAIINLLSFPTSKILNYYFPRYTNEILDLQEESIWRAP